MIYLNEGVEVFQLQLMNTCKASAKDTSGYKVRGCVLMSLLKNIIIVIRALNRSVLRFKMSNT